MDAISFKLSGAEALAAALETKPTIAARQIMRTAIGKAVQPWREEMAARVRRGWHVFARTRGIKGLRPKKGMSFAGRSREFGVIAKNIIIRTQIGASGFEGSAAVFPKKSAFWSLFLEFGARKGKMHAFPFMVPAFESRKQDVLALYIAEVRAQLHKEMGAS